MLIRPNITPVFRAFLAHRARISLASAPLSSQRHRCRLTSARLCSQRHHCKLTSAPLSSQRHHCKLTSAPLSAKMHHCKLTRARLCSQRHRCKLTMASLSSQRHRCKLARAQIVMLLDVVQCVVRNVSAGTLHTIHSTTRFSPFTMYVPCCNPARLVAFVSNRFPSRVYTL